jgi:broad specificity phosphatase PhoE
MSIAWIRHGEKIYNNGNAPPGSHDHDPPLKRDVKYKIKNLCEYLDSAGGFPTKIITSPFKRTRDTAALIHKYFYDKYGIKIDVFVDNNVSEFLGWKRPSGSIADVSKTTSAYITPILGAENLNDVEERSKQHVRTVHKDGFTLVVTHGIIIDYIHKYLTGFRLHRVKELRGVTLKDGIVKKISY